MKQLVRVGESVSFVVTKNKLALYIGDDAFPVSVGRMRQSDIIVNVDGYFSGSLFDLWMFQKIVSGKERCLFELNATLSENKTSDYRTQAPLVIDLPIGRKVDIRVFPQGKMPYLPEYPRYNVNLYAYDGESDVFDFSQIYQSTMYDGQSCVLDIKRGIAYVLLDPEYLRALVESYSESFYCLQNVGGSLDTVDMARRRRFANMWSWSNQNLWSNFDRLMEGENSLKIVNVSPWSSDVGMNVLYQLNK